MLPKIPQRRFIPVMCMHISCIPVTLRLVLIKIKQERGMING